MLVGQVLSLKIHLPSRVELCPPASLPTIVVSWGNPSLVGSDSFLGYREGEAGVEVSY